MRYTRVVNADLITPGLAPRRWIKVGGLEERIRRSKAGKEWRAPIKFSGFRVTELTRDGANFQVDQAIMGRLLERYGEQDGRERVVRRIDVILPFDDPELNLPHNLGAYKGRRLWCTGNGQEAQRLQDDGTWKARDCPCPLLTDEDAQEAQGVACKPHGSLYVLLADAPEVGGCAVFKTTSRASIQGLLGAMAMISSLTQGILRGIPLQLVMTPREGEHGVNPTVTLIYPGRAALGAGASGAGVYRELVEDGGRIAEIRRTASQHVADLEATQRRALAAAPIERDPDGQDPEEVEREFHPDVRAQAELDAAERAKRQTPEIRDQEEKPAAAAELPADVLELAEAQGLSKGQVLFKWGAAGGGPDGLAKVRRELQAAAKSAAAPAEREPEEEPEEEPRERAAPKGRRPVRSRVRF